MRKLIGTAALLAALAMTAAACGGAAVPDDNGELRITMSEFEFSPSTIELTPGETVTLILINDGTKEHEFMVGRNVRTNAEGNPDGFEIDFFEGVDAQVVPPEALEMDMAEMTGDEMTGDEMSGDEMSGDEMSGDEMSGDEMSGEHAEHGFMVAREPGEEARITFTVTEAMAGEWDIGCFEEDGAHWDDGMQGTLTITTGS